MKAEAEASLGAIEHLADKHLGSFNFWPYIRFVKTGGGKKKFLVP